MLHGRKINKNFYHLKFECVYKFKCSILLCKACFLRKG
ncbi:hypothetical protein CoNPh26_CDS0087 [Staphylococcus phage S-CoN_Ph26]|nr:hypothetical protein CoNPh26_CDS0087 [Staphylococcus phage S-CoN_Ph26]